MPKFVGDAIGARSKYVSSYTGKERKRDLDTFLQTGHHPELAKQSLDQSHILPQLPAPKITRPYVFLELTINKKVIGKVIIEIFDDIIPIQAAFFISRATQADTNTIAHTRIHKILPGLALFAGKQPNHDIVHMKQEPSLRHVDGGILSISLDGSHFCLVLSKALHLDDTHQVIGRITSGMDVLHTISSVSTKPDDSPVQSVVVSRCGMTDHEGVLESDVVGGKESLEKMQQNAEETRYAVQDALESGLKRKKPSISVLEENKKQKGKKSSKMDDILLGIGDDSDSE